MRISWSFQTSLLDPPFCGHCLLLSLDVRGCLSVSVTVCGQCLRATNNGDQLIFPDPSFRLSAPFACAPISQITSHISTNSLKNRRSRKSHYLLARQKDVKTKFLQTIVSSLNNFLSTHMRYRILSKFSTHRSYSYNPTLTIVLLYISFFIFHSRASLPVSHEIERGLRVVYFLPHLTRIHYKHI